MFYGLAPLVALLQEGDVTTSPIVVAIMALLAIPAVTSGLTGVLRYLTDGMGVNPRVVVWVASLVVVWLAAPSELPAWAGDPVAYQVALLAWATGNTAGARAVYDLIKPLVWPDPAPTF